MTKWLYKKGVNYSNDALKNLGEKGWELVNVVGVVRYVPSPSDELPYTEKMDRPIENALVYVFKKPE